MKKLRTVHGAIYGVLERAQVPPKGPSCEPRVAFLTRLGSAGKISAELAELEQAMKPLDTVPASLVGCIDVDRVGKVLNRMQREIAIATEMERLNAQGKAASYTEVVSILSQAGDLKMD